MTTARLFTCLLFAASGLHAQTVTTTGGASHGPPVSPVWNVTGVFTLGYFGNDASMTIANGGQVISEKSYVASGEGYAALVTISGAGSSWNFESLHLGLFGRGTMLVSDGAHAIGTGDIQMAGSGQSSGTLTVTGSGSLVESNQILIGSARPGTVRVEAGGQLKSRIAGYIGSRDLASSVTVTGAGSLWSMGSYLYVGLSEGTGTLTIADRGTVTTGTSYIGISAAGNGTITVTGSGSKLQNSGDLIVGKDGSGTLTIEAGGLVTNRSGYLGNDATGAGTVTVTGPNSQWTNSAALYVGETGAGTLTVSDGATVTNTYGYIGTRVGSTSSATVTGANSLWQSANSLAVGYSGSGTLTIGSGGHVDAKGSYIGYDAGSSGSATVTGIGSLWTSAEPFRVGDGGSGTLTVAAGGTVRVGNGGGSLSIAEKAGSSGTVNIGSPDLLAPTTSGTLDVSAITFGLGSGRINFNQTDDITFAATLSGQGLIVQRGAGTTTLTGVSTITTSAPFEGVTTIKNGTLAVKGSGASLTHSGGGVYVGDTNGDNGTLQISNGAHVSNTAGYVGVRKGATGTTTITGTGSLWQNSSSLAIGYQGTGSLTISSGGQASSAGIYIGFAKDSSGEAVVSGTDSKWTSTALISVGETGMGTLTIENGAVVSGTGTGFLGHLEGGNGSALITGAGSAWTQTINLSVGSYGTGELVISNGGLASSQIGYLGAWPSGVGTVTITGAGSLWANSTDLFVGDDGVGTLTVANGGIARVNSGAGTLTIGTVATATGTLNIGAYDLLAPTTAGVLDVAAIVFGEGAGVINFNQTGTSTLGQKITGNGKLVQRGSGTTVLTGATTLTSTDTFGGITTIKQGKLAVDGAGASLTQSGSSIYVGTASGDNGTLEVRNGGSVSSAYGYLGQQSGSTGAASVTGSGSKWQLGHSLAVGYVGDGALTVANGGVISSFDGYLGYSGGTTGDATIRGAGSLWQAVTSVYVGESGTGTLTVSDGGTVRASTINLAIREGSTGTLNIGAYDLLTPTGAGVVDATEIAFRSGTGTINFNQADELTLDALISGNGRLVQRGRGKTILTGNSTYTGPTTVEAGTLFVEGSITGDVTVKDGATFGGDGVVGSITLESGSTLMPGDELDAKALLWNPGATLVFGLGDATSDRLALSGNFLKGGDGTFAFAFADAGWKVGQTYTLITFVGTGFNESDFSLVNGGDFDGTFAFDGGSLTFHLVAVPEPSTFALVGLGLLGLGSLRRTRKRFGASVSR